jgi:hypothetical protein
MFVYDKIDNPLEMASGVVSGLMSSLLPNYCMVALFLYSTYIYVVYQVDSERGGGPFQKCLLQ